MGKKQDGKYICKCECGGQVRGVEQFGRLFTWCETCTPVVPTSPMVERTMKAFESGLTRRAAYGPPSKH